MDPKLERDVAVAALKTAALQHRNQLVLALADQLNECHQLIATQQKLIAALAAAYETRVNPVSEPVRETPPTPPHRDSDSSGRLDLSGLKEVRGADVVRNSDQMPGG